jgi:aminoglycoside N3'-acetyltransferase
VPLKVLTREYLTSSLIKIGIVEGDRLLIHSAIQFLGKPEGGIDMIYQSLQSMLTPSGTIVVPAFTFEFAKSAEFYTQNTPSRGMGIFSEYVRQLPGSKRTSHPLQSIAAIGYYADDLTSRDTPCAFDEGSAFERMLDLDFNCLLLGANINACSIIHFSEQRANVPYRYWKNLSGLLDGKYAIYRMFVRDLELDPLLDLDLIKASLVGQGLWNEVQVNYGTLATFKLQDFRKSADELLSKDPFCLLSNLESVKEKLIKRQEDLLDR